MTPTQKQAKQAALKIHARIVVHDLGPGCQAAETRVVDTPCTNDGARQCAHIISRRYDATSTHIPNGWSLCPGHHRQIDTNPLLWATLVHATVGFDTVRYWKQRVIVGSRLAWWRQRLSVMVAYADIAGVDLDGLPVRPIQWARQQMNHEDL